MADHDDQPLPPPTLRRLHEQGATIVCWCRACSAERELDPAEVADRAGWLARFPHVRDRMRCTTCGSRDVTARPLYPKVP